MQIKATLQKLNLLKSLLLPPLICHKNTFFVAFFCSMLCHYVVLSTSVFCRKNANKIIFFSSFDWTFLLFAISWMCCCVASLSKYFWWVLRHFEPSFLFRGPFSDSQRVQHMFYSAFFVKEPLGVPYNLNKIFFEIFRLCYQTKLSQSFCNFLISSRFASRLQISATFSIFHPNFTSLW